MGTRWGGDDAVDKGRESNLFRDVGYAEVVNVNAFDLFVNLNDVVSSVNVGLAPFSALIKQA